ncbi:MAG: MFS transporter [Candidatus Izemoplasmatales bacterium]|nr:MFS transporter [bacterium]MDZ4196756.1 MFS transporter [Candidatus Izemoplasmatales bacterium]
MKKKLLLLAVIYIIFIALGLPDALLGSGWNLIREELNVPLATLGIMTICVYSMSVLATFNAPRLLRLLETKKIAIISVFFTGAALLLISQVNQFYQMLFLAIPLGIGAGAIDVSLNHYLAANYEAKHMNYLHSFYGIGVTLGPTVMAYTLSQDSWRNGYIIVGLMLLTIALIGLFTHKLWAKEPKQEREDTHAHIQLKDILKTKGAIPSILIFLFYVHIESLGGVWIASYFFIEKGVSYAVAALYTTAFYLALTVGRLLSGFVSSKVSPQFLVKLGQTLIVLSAFLLFVDFSQTWVYFLIVGLFGLGCAPIYPNMMFLNSVYFEKKQLSKMVSLQMALGYLGFGALTPLAGLLFEKTTIAYFPIVLILMSSVLFGITLYLMISKKPRLV